MVLGKTIRGTIIIYYLIFVGRLVPLTVSNTFLRKKIYQWYLLAPLQNGKRPEELRMKDLNSPCQFVTSIIRMHRFCTLVCELVSEYCDIVNDEWYVRYDTMPSSGAYRYAWSVGRLHP
jgi:hypothetical protein